MEQKYHINIQFPTIPTKVSNGILNILGPTQFQNMRPQRTDNTFKI
jgi:hypothetical protein